MNVLYIAPYSEGSTSKMRGEYLKEILKPRVFKIIDTDIPLNKTGQPFRSIGWRFKKGPLISNISSFIQGQLNDNEIFDLVWVDKGVFILPDVINKLRKLARKLVHYTPDPSFTFHQSKLFYQAIPLYDYCITTKSFEVDTYKRYGVKTILCTQGYDQTIHKSFHRFEEKNGLVFIGHWEEEREEMLSKLLAVKIPLQLAGEKWEKFSRKHLGKGHLTYKGKGIYGEQYARAISGALMGIGFLSKWIPELHTTRTLEIPACNTALVTERNQETQSIFNADEAIFFSNTEEFIERIRYYDSHRTALEILTTKGHNRVINGGYTYYEILKNVVRQLND